MMLLRFMLGVLGAAAGIVASASWGQVLGEGGARFATTAGGVTNKATDKPGTLVVGIAKSGAPPFEIVDESGVMTGVSADYLELLSTRLKRPIRIEIEPTFARVLERVADGSIDLLATVARTPEREKSLAFTAPYFESTPVVVVRKNDSAANNPAGTTAEADASNSGPVSLGDLRPRTISVERGYAVVEFIRKEYPSGNLIETNDTREALAAVARGEADVYVGDLFTAAYLMERELMSSLVIKTAAGFRTGELRFAARSDKLALRDQIDDALRELDTEARDIIRKRWLPFARLIERGASRVALSPGEQAWLKANPVVRVGADANYQPYSWINEGKLEGVSADYLRLIAERTGINFHLTQERRWPSLLEMLRSRELDVLLPVARTPSRESYVSFVGKHAQFHTIIVTAANSPYVGGLASLSGKRVAVGGGYAVEELMARDYPAIIRVPVGDQSEALELVARHRVDAAVATLEVVGLLMQTRFLGELRVAANVPEFVNELNFGVRKGAPELETILTKGLATISPLEREAINVRWFSVHLESESNWRLSTRRWLPFIALLVLALAFYVWWNYRLRRQIALTNAARAETAYQLAFQSTLLDTIPSPVFFKDQEGRYLGCNRAFERVFEIKREDFIGKTILQTDIFTPERRAEIFEGDRGFMTRGGTETRALRMIDNSGTRDLYSTSTTFRLPSGEVGGLLTLLTDVTSVHAQERALEEAKQLAEAATEAKSTFLATMSHEIRTPLNGVIGMLELLSLSKLDGQQRAQVKTIQSSSHALLGILNDVLDFSRIEAGKMELEHVRFNPATLIEEVAQTLASVAAQKGLRFRLEIDPALPQPLMGDPNRIRQVLLNLLSNAIKFTEQGTIELTARSGGASGKFSAAHRVMFEVRDSGIGMNSAAQDSLFSSFAQADSSTARRYGGSGLGLAICKRLTELMEGSLSVESTPGQGSRFQFELRLEVCEDTAAFIESKTAQRTASALEGRRTVLLGASAADDAYLTTLCASWRMYPAVPAMMPPTIAHLMHLLTAQAADCALIDLDALSGRLGESLASTQNHLIAMRDARPEIAQCALVMLVQRPPWGLSASSTQTPGPAQGERALALVAGQARAVLVGVSPLIPSDLQRQCGIALGASLESSQSFHAISAIDAAQAIAAVGGPRVMIVDDHPVAREVLNGQLRALGFAPFAFESAQVALAQFVQAEATDTPFTVVITDLQMPDMDGFAFASALRAGRIKSGKASGMASGIAAPLYVIATSAGTNPDTAAKALAAGANELLTKPYSIQTLQNQLRAALGEAMPSAHARLRSAQLTQRIGLGRHDEHVMQPELSGPDRSDPALRAAFVASCRQDFAALEAAAHAGDATEVRRQAHRLRGAALLMGAMGIAEGAAELETAQPSVALQRALPTLARMRTMLESP